jgi:hypothetical protein
MNIDEILGKNKELNQIYLSNTDVQSTFIAIRNNPDQATELLMGLIIILGKQNLELEKALRKIRENIQDVRFYL